MSKASERSDDGAQRDPPPLGEGLTALDQDLAGTMASEGGRSAQVVEAPLTTADVSILRRRRLSLYATAGIAALAGGMLALSMMRLRSSPRSR